MHNLRAALPVAAALMTLSTAAFASVLDSLEPDFRVFLSTFEDGTRRFVSGDPEPWKANVSRRPDVMIMGAWGAHERGWPDVSARYDWAAARFEPSSAKLDVDYLAAAVSGDLAYTTAIERSEVKIVGESTPLAMALRVTHIFRKEDGAWKLMLRHADPLMAKTAPDAVLRKPEPRTPDDAKSVISFWREAGPGLWFAKDAAFDHRFRERFLALHESAARGELTSWSTTAEGALALLILLDQFPRNAFRGTPRMYDTDALARRTADAAIKAGHDQQIDPGLRLFVYLPFAHSEDLADQERSVALSRTLGEPNLTLAMRHRDIIRRFGRFPHRNPILGRHMTPEEQHYLDNGGFKG